MDHPNLAPNPSTASLCTIGRQQHGPGRLDAITMTTGERTQRDGCETKKSLDYRKTSARFPCRHVHLLRNAAGIWKRATAVVVFLRTADIHTHARTRTHTEGSGGVRRLHAIMQTFVSAAPEGLNLDAGVENEAQQVEFKKKER